MRAPLHRDRPDVRPPAAEASRPGWVSSPTGCEGTTTEEDIG